MTDYASRSLGNAGKKKKKMALKFAFAWTSMRFSMKIGTQPHDSLRLLFTAFSKKNQRNQICSKGIIFQLSRLTFFIGKTSSLYKGKFCPKSSNFGAKKWGETRTFHPPFVERNFWEETCSFKPNIDELFFCCLYFSFYACPCDWALSLLWRPWQLQMTSKLSLPALA